MNDKKELLSDEEEALIAAISGPSLATDVAAAGPGEPLTEGEVRDVLVEEFPSLEGLSPQAALAQDMKLLVALDARLGKLGADQLAAEAVAEGLIPDELEVIRKVAKLITSVRKEFNSLKKDISAEALVIYEKSGEKDPALGVKITMNKSRILTVDEAAAVSWCVASGHESLLVLQRESYSDLLQTGVMKDQPGEVSVSDRAGCRISLKPYQEAPK